MVLQIIKFTRKNGKYDIFLTIYNRLNFSIYLYLFASNKYKNYFKIK